MCEINSKVIVVCRIIENLFINLQGYPKRKIIMDVIIIDIPEVWGMLLSKKMGHFPCEFTNPDGYVPHKIPMGENPYALISRRPPIEPLIECLFATSDENVEDCGFGEWRISHKVLF